jgi:hypothetical protein
MTHFQGEIWPKCIGTGVSLGATFPAVADREKSASLPQNTPVNLKEQDLELIGGIDAASLI